LRALNRVPPRFRFAHLGGEPSPSKPIHGSLYAFFANGNLPNNFFTPQLQLENIDLSNSTTHFVTDVDPNAVFISGAVPDVRNPPPSFC
jgi:hypothetical protein